MAGSQATEPWRMEDVTVFMSTRVTILRNVSDPSTTWPFSWVLEMRHCHPRVTGTPPVLGTCLSPVVLADSAGYHLPRGSFLNSSWIPLPTSTWGPLLWAPTALFTSVIALRIFYCSVVNSSHVALLTMYQAFLFVCLTFCWISVSLWVRTALVISVASAPSTSLTHGSNLLNASWWMNTYDTFNYRDRHKNIFLRLRNISVFEILDEGILEASWGTVFLFLSFEIYLHWIGSNKLNSLISNLWTVWIIQPLWNVKITSWPHIKRWTIRWLQTLWYVNILLLLKIILHFSLPPPAAPPAAAAAPPPPLPLPPPLFPPLSLPLSLNCSRYKAPYPHPP